MEQLTIRDWMVIIGAGLILAVLVDAVRRVWRERRAEVRLNAKITRADEDDREEVPFNLLAELPNGGARIVARDDLQPLDEVSRGTRGEDGAPNFTATDPDESPLDAAADRDPALEEAGVEPEQTLGDTPEEPDSTVHAADLDSAATQSLGEQPSTRSHDKRRTRASRRQRAAAVDDDAPETLDWLETLDTEAQPAAEARLPRDVEPHVFVLNVVARAPEGFAGSDILQILLACDLRFGDMDFFHRHESASGRGPIQFSVANMMNPGVFDIDAMDELHTRGLMFFVTLPGPENMLQAFDYMYETAKAVARNLDGDVLDDTRSAITRQSLEHMRQQIRELERRMMVGRER